MPEWELLVHIPAVFVRVANNGLTEYGTWKCKRKMGDGSGTRGNVREVRGEGRAFGLKDVPPVFFVSVASKAFSDVANLLFAILTREAISVAAKGLTRMKCWQKVTVLGWEDFEGVRRTTWRGRMVSGARSLPAGWSVRSRQDRNLRFPRVRRAGEAIVPI